MTAPAIRRCPNARAHAALGATFETQAGWEIPSTYGDAGVERARVRELIGIADLTARAKIDLRGAIDGVAGATGDAILARIAEDWALVLDEPGAEDVLLPKLESAAGAAAMVTDATHLFAGVGLVGPRVGDALARLTSWDPTTVAPGAATGAPIADVRAVVVRRELDAPVLEVYTAMELARYVWETVSGVVSAMGGGPVGWSALREEGWR